MLFTGLKKHAKYIVRLILLVLICTSLLTVQVSPSVGEMASPQVIYADALATGWDNWSWASVNLQATSYVHSGTYSIAVTYGAWEGLYLRYPELSMSGFTHLRFYLHGGSQGGQRVNLYMILVNGEVETNGPPVALPQALANTWIEVQVPLADLGAGGANITGIVWQDATGGSQPTLYLDDIALVSDEDPNGPVLSGGTVMPRSIPADGLTDIVVRVNVSDPQGLTDIDSVTVDASGLGRGILALQDDGRSNDGAANDGLYGTALSIAAGVQGGERVLVLTAEDQAGHRSSLPTGVLIVLAPPGGQIPASLPGRIGWGSNAWDEDPGQDWQVNSGVPWDYVYQYITYEWYRDGWGGNFVGRFVNHAWDYDFIPMVTVYMMLGLPPTCGEGGTCYADKLQNHTAVQTYLAALAEAARQAQGSDPVIFNLEPDFYGFMQQYSNSNGRPPGVHIDDPTSIPVALNIPGYPNNLAGFGQRMVDVIHTTAPNALVAPMASMWATNADPLSATSTGAIEMAQRTAHFIDVMGGAQADLLVVEWSDRDAGSGLRPWWDDTDRNPPRPTRAILWENALSNASHKRLFLWQMPVGNMSLDNTCDHYQDNRAAYAFSHPRDLVDAGVIGVLFGGGATCMTRVDTDGGFVAAQGAVAYANPAAPSELVAGPVNGPVVSLRWNENSEPDLWGYRVLYQPEGGGTVITIDAGRRNALTLPLPRAGNWRIQVVAYDAMGHSSQPSAAVIVTTSADAHIAFLPVTRR